MSDAFKNIQRLYGVLGPWKKHYLFAGFLLILTTLFRMLEPKVLQVAIDRIILFFNEENTYEADQVAQFFFDLVSGKELLLSLLLIGGIYILLALFRGLTNFLSGVITADSTEKAIKRLRDYIFRHIQALPIPTVEKLQTGEMIQRSTGDVTTVKNFVGSQVTEVIRLVAIALGAFVMMYMVHIPYALISVVLLPLILITAILFFKKEGVVWEEHEKEQDKLTAIVQENLSGIRVVQSFAMEDYEIEKFQKQNEVKLKVGLKHIKLHQWFWMYSDLLISLQIGFSLIFGAYLALNQQITPGEYVSFFTYAVMVTWPMRSLGRVVSQMGMATVAMGRMTDILDAAEEDYQGWDSEENIQGKIEFRNVTFTYPGEEKPALNQVSFTIEVGQKVALIGRTGAGKSTIVVLLARFYEPDEGEILLDGRSLNTYSKAYLRTQLGIVLQKPFLFSASIKDNIAFANFDATEEAVFAAAKDAAIGDFINKLPNGYQTMLGEKGVNLSGGQKQRVALARTLLANPSVMILDDATSAVDTETEFSIQNALKRRLKTHTTLTIAHRLTAIQQADLIIVFEDGKVIEQGDHHSLLKAKGFYHKVYEIQIAVEEDILTTISEPGN